MVNRHRQRLRCELDREPGVHRPAHHGARVAVEDHCKIEPTFHGPDVGDVSGPDPVWTCDRELAIAPVRRHGPPVIRVGGRPPFLHGFGTEAIGAHPAGHAPLADPMPSLHEDLPDAGTSVGLTALPVDQADVCQEDTVRRTSRTLWPRAPGVVPRRRHRARTAHEPNGIAAAVLANGSIFHRDSFAKHAAARRKTSRSWVIRASSRVTRVSSSASAIQHVVRNPQVPGHLSHGAGRLTHQPHRLQRKFLGIPTSCSCWHDVLRFHYSPSY